MLVVESLSCLFDRNKRIIVEVIENILEITCKATTICSQHDNDFEWLWTFEDVTVSDHLEILLNAFTILIKDVYNCKTESCFLTQRVWHSERKKIGQNNWFNTKFRLADELKNCYNFRNRSKCITNKYLFVTTFY